MILPVALLVAVTAAAPSAIELDGQTLTVTTPTVRAVFEAATIVSIQPVGTDVEFGQPSESGQGLDGVFGNWNLVGVDKKQVIGAKILSPFAARIDVEGADSHRSLLIAIDQATGDIIVRPDAMTNRRNLRAVRWTVPINDACWLVVPAINGLRFPAAEDDPWPPTRRWQWPFEWNAQMVIAERDDYAMMIHCEDTQWKYKVLHLQRQPGYTELALDVELPGPMWEQRTVGGVEWRLNCYRGDWQVPAARFRDWMKRAYDLDAHRANRPSWVDRITLAQSWAAPKIEMLEALAALHPPDQTLIHLSTWRTDKYDLNYPTYDASQATIDYMAKAREMGFHVMPHFNYHACCYDHPLYRKVAAFQLRSADTNEPQGWHWPPATHDYTRMAYIHPGLGLWRDTLMDNLFAACSQLDTDVAFIDQTLCTWNADNAFVGGLNTIEAMMQLQDEMSMVRPDLMIAGEGLTEASFQREAFAQAHIFEGWDTLNDRQVAIQHHINAFLWDGHTKLIGYYHLGPNKDDFGKGVEIYEKMHALPTIITNNPKHLTEMAPPMQRIFEHARQLSEALPATAPAP